MIKRGRCSRRCSKKCSSCRADGPVAWSATVTFRYPPSIRKLDQRLLSALIACAMTYWNRRSAGLTESRPPSDLIKDPFVLEFTGLRQDERLLKSDPERALLAKLQQFLLELGRASRSWAGSSGSHSMAGISKDDDPAASVGCEGLRAGFLACHAWRGLAATAAVRFKANLDPAYSRAFCCLETDARPCCGSSPWGH